MNNLMVLKNMQHIITHKVFLTSLSATSILLLFRVIYDLNNLKFKSKYNNFVTTPVIFSTEVSTTGSKQLDYKRSALSK